MFTFHWRHFSDGGTPRYLGGIDAFKQDFVVPLRDRGSKDKASVQTQSELLKSILNPFLLRRRKTDKKLLPELPDRVDYAIEVDLTGAQRQLGSLSRRVVRQHTDR